MTHRPGGAPLNICHPKCTGLRGSAMTVRQLGCLPRFNRERALRLVRLASSTVRGIVAVLDARWAGDLNARSMVFKSLLATYHP